METQNLKKLNYIKLIPIILITLYFINCIQNPDTFHFIASVNLIIHEAGHFIFMFFGEFIHILGGSLIQVLIPLIFAVYFFLRKDNFSGGIILMWVGESITEVAHYASDSILMQLPLLGGDNVIHDWNWLLTNTHLLQYTSIISELIYGVGIFALVIGVTLSFVSLFKKEIIVNKL